MKLSHAFARLVIGLAMVILIGSSGPLQAAETTNQFLFLTLRLKGGIVTLEKASVVSGTLKPQQDSTDAEPLLVTLEQADGVERWSFAMDDPSIQRYEYEDPQHPGSLKLKLVPVDDIEFIARVPLSVGVRRMAVYRKQKSTQPAKAGASAATKRLLARIELPREVTK
jgi:hypothetical protein